MDRPARLVDQGNLLLAFNEPEPFRISRQVLREHMAVVSRPKTWLLPIPHEIALDDKEGLVATFGILEDGPVKTDSLVSPCRGVPVGGRQIHDANILAIMLARGGSRLSTLNRSDIRRDVNGIELVGG